MKNKELIFSTIDEINKELPLKSQIKKNETAVLWGKNGRLDSLTLVRFVVALENKIKEETGKIVNLADEKMLSKKDSPFVDIKRLNKYLDNVLNK